MKPGRLAALAAAFGALATLAGCDVSVAPSGDSPPAPPAAVERAPAPATSPDVGSVDSIAPSSASEAPALALPGAGAAELRQVRRTLDLIASGGPFLHRKDGAVFGNREGRLPPRPRGYYREYTVETPGTRDRGARRIVQGRDGETYYTDDHYRTFTRIDAGALP